MRAEIISIGDELVTGQRLDTNTQWLSERLCELGVRVLVHTTVGDDLEANVQVFRQAVERADIVIATGGLGPTADDLTREALARTASVELALDNEQLDAIRAMFGRRGRPMPEQNRLQAMFPVGSHPIPNPNGTAPGVDMVIARRGCAESLGDRSRVFALPGVPAEMFEMFQASVAPIVRQLQPSGKVIVHHRIKCYGAGESHLEAMLPDLIRRGRQPSVGITVSRATITLRITAEGATAEECRRAMDGTIAAIRAALGTLVYGEEDDELEDAVARLLVERGETLSTAEWGSGGTIAGNLDDVPLAAEHYRGGLVVRDADALARLLDVPASLTESHGPTSAEVAQAMADACRRRFATDYALSVSDVPRIDPQAAEPPRLHVALATAAGVTVRSFPYAGHPDILKSRGAKDAVNYLRLELLARQTRPPGSDEY